MRSSHRLFIQLQHSAPTTGDIESSLLPTLTTMDSIDRKRMRPSRAATNRKTGYLSEMLLPTLMESDGDSAGGPNANHLMLNKIAKMLPTLTGSSYGTNQGGKAGRVGKIRPSLQIIAKLLPTLTASTATLADMEQARYAGSDPMRPKYSEAKLLPTLRAADGLKGIRTPGGAAKERIRKKQGVDLPTAAGGTLDPVFCEWYMGFEDEWTDVE